MQEFISRLAQQGDYGFVYNSKTKTVEYMDCDLDKKIYNLYTQPRASIIIDYLFDRYSDWSVISTKNEHSSVNRRLNDLEDKYLLDFPTEIEHLDLTRVEQWLGNKTKIFVYIIGTQISSGTRTNQHLFIKLKALLASKGIQCVFVLDACQELFLVPRDLSIFDYIVYTCHSLLMYYNMGILITSKTTELGADEEGVRKYFELMHSIDGSALQWFKTLMIDRFGNWIAKKGIEQVSEVGHIFSLKIEANRVKYVDQAMYDLMDKYGVRIEGLNTLDQQRKENGQVFIHLRVRIQHYLANPGHFERAMDYMQYWLENYLENLK